MLHVAIIAPSVDPISVAVIANRLAAITKEMGQIMLLTSRSPIFSESRDFVTAIFDDRAQLVAQTSYIPVLLGAIPFAMKAICRKYQNQELHAGDVIIANDPYEGNSHLPDVTIARPVFYQERLAFWSVTKGHQADLGGAGVAGYNPAAKTVWEEGLRLPAIKLYERGKYQSDVWDLILLNVKSRHLVEGDLHCQIGATARGEEALIELLDRYGSATVEAAIASYLNATEKKMAAAIQAIPDGGYSGERGLDNDGIEMDRVANVRVDLTVDGQKLKFDFSRSDKQTRGYVNSPLANTASVCFQALFACIGSAIPINAGSLRLIDIVAPEGSIVNCRPPAPTTASTLAHLRRHRRRDLDRAGQGGSSPVASRLGPQMRADERRAQPAHRPRLRVHASQLQRRLGRHGRLRWLEPHRSGEQYGRLARHRPGDLRSGVPLHTIAIRVGAGHGRSRTMARRHRRHAPLARRDVRDPMRHCRLGHARRDASLRSPGR